MSGETLEFKDNTRKIYVVGHRNPDTDSICSAIAYANLKNQLIGVEEPVYQPRRAGQINGETQFVLQYFGAEEPKYLSNLRKQVKNVELHKVSGIKGTTSIKEAWSLMKQENIKTLPIVRDEKLEGVITMGDIMESYMNVSDSRALFNARTQYRNIASTIHGEVVWGNEHGYLLDGKIVVGASAPETMCEFVEENDLIIIGNRAEAQQRAVDMNVSCMVISQGTGVSDEILEQAKEKDIVIITTPYDTFTVARLINQSIPVRHFMTRAPYLTTFKMWDYCEDVKEVMTKNKVSDFPILDKEGNFLGFISRRRLLNAYKKQVIMVDHNEKGQAVDGIEEADVVEIIDHHKLGGIETMGPVYFRNQPVGCTSTIVYQMYLEEQVEISPMIAGLLCSAILSDTLMFRSPTCTPLDEKAARTLAKIAGIEVEEFAQKMFVEGSNLKGKTPEEICFMDFKQFKAGGKKFGAGQITSLNDSELENIKESLLPYLETARVEQGLDMVYMMLTNIIEESTELLCVGKESKEKILQAFKLDESTQDIILPGVMSRKKQLIPPLVSILQQ